MKPVKASAADMEFSYFVLDLKARETAKGFGPSVYSASGWTLY